MAKEDGKLITRSQYLDYYERDRKKLNVSVSVWPRGSKAAQKHAHSCTGRRDSATPTPPSYLAIFP